MGRVSIGCAPPARLSLMKASPMAPGVPLPSEMLSKYQSKPRFEAFRFQLWRVAAFPPWRLRGALRSERAALVAQATP
jgi:hypothetical protein